ncbi:hypothetical protein [Actinomadura flavalba]|uniref:hypothetical protein n=1 Tax=Actinomadura flavalba TaxID=1120938 RepID=UPI00035C9C1F|nr:hypothetical protein [Actinomadura flavalba]
MTPCGVTTGFFVLGHCGQPAVAGCPGCGQPVCGAHVSAQGFCPECVARQGYRTDDPYDPAWVHQRRRSYYQSSSRTYSDALWYSSFDSYDRGGFNPGDDWAAGGDFGDEGDAFVDS